MKRNAAIVLLSVLSLLLAGCSDSHYHLKPSTEMMLDQNGANAVLVNALLALLLLWNQGAGHNSVLEHLGLSPRRPQAMTQPQTPPCLPCQSVRQYS